MSPLGVALMPTSLHVMKIQNAKKCKKRFLAKGLIQFAESAHESRTEDFARFGLAKEPVLRGSQFLRYGTGFDQGCIRQRLPAVERYKAIASHGHDVIDPSMLLVDKFVLQTTQLEPIWLPGQVVE